MTAVADQLGEWRRRRFRRVLAVSAAVHVGAVLLIGITPTSRTSFSRPEVIAVDVVVAGPPRRARPAPAPAPVPVKKKIVLPKQPTLPKPEAKPRPKPQRRELDPSELEQPAPPQDYEDVMAQLRADASEPAAEPAPPEPVQVASAAAGVAGSGRPVPPEVAAWMRRAKIHVRRAWVVPPGFRVQPLETRVMVRLDAAGTVLGEPRIVRRSGNPWYDDGVVRGVQKASPLPPPPEAGEWEFIFVPEDSY